MSSSLDKLKALTSKLDDRLAKKSASAYEPNPLLTKSESEPPKEPVKSVTAPPVSKPKPAMTVLVKEENAEKIRMENIERVKILYDELKIFEKSPDFDTIFMYKAMNLSGIGLKEEDFGVVRAGKYIQVIAITYEPDASGKKKAKNISLGYFGKGETIDPDLKNKIIEFVLRWRYEKAFQNVEHYKVLLSKLDRPKTLF
ncbi:MAG: hypothetical protein U9R26_05580 [Campylobacterota bacterium]|nr:hypothetical protein [Campylobacterota bacterium]